MLPGGDQLELKESKCKWRMALVISLVLRIFFASYIGSLSRLSSPPGELALLTFAFTLNNNSGEFAEKKG